MFLVVVVVFLLFTDITFARDINQIANEVLMTCVTDVGRELTVKKRPPPKKKARSKLSELVRHKLERQDS